MQNSEQNQGQDVNHSQDNVNGTTTDHNMNLHYHNSLVPNYSTNGGNQCIPQMFDPNNLGALPNMTSDSSNLNDQQMMQYLQALAGVTNMVACQPSTTSSEDMQGDSSTTSSSVQHLQGFPHYGIPIHNMAGMTGQTIPQNFNALAPHSSIGGVQIPPVPSNSTSAMQIEVAAAAAAMAAAPPKGYHVPTSIQGDSDETDLKRGTKRTAQTMQLNTEEKKKQNRERNREHAKSTRLRKKAYVNKLKELVEGLHAERSEEGRNRRAATQHLAEVQRVRRAVIKDFLQSHSRYESDPRKWSTILEDSFVLWQPVTPYRSFRKSEIENTKDRQQRRKAKGIEAIITDASSMSVMVEGVGIRSARWKHIKRDEFLKKEEARTGTVRSRMPRSIVRQDRFQHAISSLSSSSGYSTGNGSSGDSGEEDKKMEKKQSPDIQKAAKPDKNGQVCIKRKNISSSSSGGSGQSSDQQKPVENLFHDYHAQPLPDPKLDSGGSAGSNSVTEHDSDNAVVNKHIDTDSTSGEEDKLKHISSKKRHTPATLELTTDQTEPTPNAPRIAFVAKDASTPEDGTVPISLPSTSTHDLGKNDSKLKSSMSSLPSNIAQKGGIFHNVRPAVVASATDANPRLNSAPATQLPPFSGLGKSKIPKEALDPNVSVIRSNSSGSGVVASAQPPKPVNVICDSTAGDPLPQPTSAPSVAQPVLSSTSNQVANLIGVENDDRSSEDLESTQIQAFYHVNEDDMLLTDDILMCPFIFRTQDAVLCGALAECVMPGMLRAQFSKRNKLLSIEMVYDAMGFMQQLGRASGNEAVAEIIPNSLEMSLQPSNEEARVITTAKAPYSIVSVNSAWTKLTKFTQLEVEKKDLLILEGKRTDPEAFSRPGMPSHTPSAVALGSAACSTNIYYDKYGKAFVAFASSYPLTNSSNEVTHILHIFNELPEYQ